VGNGVAAAAALFWVGGEAGSAPADLASALQDCARLTEPQQRLDCYDAVAGHVNAGETSRLKDPGPEGMAPSAPVAVVDETDAAPRGEDPTEEAHDFRWLGFRPYRRNYLLPVSYNSRVNEDPFADVADEFDVDDLEIKFQLSFEVPVLERIAGSDIDLYFAYTQLSFFQAYNTDYSSPFRDTSYEPELGLNWHPDLKFLGWTLGSARLALDHQSNGRSEPLSRSWNRVIGQLQMARGPLHVGLRAWQRIEENAQDDDNPDITDFLGYGELSLGYDLGRHRLGLMLRNPLEHAAVQADWSFPLGERVRFYVQYFNGYGESLIDYDRQVNRIGAGFLLNDWP
jgi:phospholipase A1